MYTRTHSDIELWAIAQFRVRTAIHSDKCARTASAMLATLTMSYELYGLGAHVHLCGWVSVW